MATEETTLVAGETTITAQGASAGEERGAHAIARGTSVGRYVVLGVLGTGAMGIVLVAYDPDLDRRVAIKLLRAIDGDGSTGRALLLREAQAMARLNHPNVVTIHDVGEHESRVYLAMELVEGQTLREWQGSRTRTWKEIAAVYRQAAEGLAAAHGAGLVHRDFKPENVLVASDGRVLVTDFGLARVNHAEVTAEAGASGSMAALELTRTGTLAGTPAYMAPEQLAGRSADARSDQFAFCVALFEALHGARPFVASSLPELVRVVSAGEVREPSSSIGPGWLRAAIRRGLAVDPAARHPSMHALLERMGQGPHHARRRWALLVGGVLVVTGVAARAARPDPAAKVCRTGEDRVAEVWHDDRRTAIESAFSRTGIPHADATFADASGRLDAWAPQWARAHREACEATHVRGEQSGERLDARMGCLRQQLGKVDALLTELENPDEGVLERASGAMMSLPTPSTCDDPGAATLVEDPAVRERLERAQRALATAQARNELGRYAMGVPAAQEAVTLAGDADPSLAALALTTEAQLHDRSGDAKRADEVVRRALATAVEAGDHGIEAEAWLELVMLTGSTRALPQEAIPLLLPAELATRHTGRADLERRFHDVAGIVLSKAGRFGEAIEHHERAIELADADEIDGEGRSVVHANFGNSLYEAGRYAQAREQFEIALDVARRTHGSDHPSTATDMFQLARGLGAEGEYVRAAELYEEAIRVREAALGPEHRDVGDARLNFGLILARQGRRDEGRAQIERAIGIWEKTLEPDHPHLSIAHNNLGTIALEQQRHDDALTEFREAEAIVRRRSGDENLQLAAPLLNQGLVLTEREDYEGALSAFDRVIALESKLLAPDHPDIAYALVAKGQALVELHRPLEALPLLERALRIREAGHREPAEMYLTYFMLARAVLDSGGDRERAVTLAEKAHDAFVKTGLDMSDAGALPAWLKEHGRGGR